MTFDEEQLNKFGFAEVTVEDGMTSATKYTAECSGSRSACCTRTCSADPAFVGSAADWDAFLDVRGGQIQY